MLFNTDLENNILGQLIAYPNTYFEVADKLPEEAFFDEVNKFVYKCIKAVANSSVIDLITITEHAITNIHELPPMYKDVNIPYTISAYTGRVSSNVNILEHVHILNEYRKRRQLSSLGSTIKESIDAKKSTDDIVQELQDEIMKITIDNSKGEQSLSECLIEFNEDQNKPLENNIIPSDIPELDDVIGGAELSDLIIIAGASSMGKTSFALKLLLNFLIRGKNCMVFSMEMSNKQLTTRLIAMETDINIKDIRYRNLDQADYSKINDSYTKLEKLNLIMDGESSKLTDILNKIKKNVISKGTEIIFIDYLQLVTYTTKKGNRQEEVAKIARSLKNIAKETNTVVIALSQLNRANSIRDNKRPILSDLRESGEIEQAADIIMFAYREEYYSMENPREIQDAEIIIAKGRNVGLGTAHLKFKPKTTKFISPRNESHLLNEEEYY
jgi:replicative DNA helicase